MDELKRERVTKKRKVVPFGRVTGGSGDKTAAAEFTNSQKRHHGLKTRWIRKARRPGNPKSLSKFLRTENM